MRTTAVTLFFLFIALLVATATDTAAKNDAERLTKSKCTFCHSADRICKNLGRRNPVMWQKTIEKMQRKGARVSASEKAVIAQFLGTTRPDKTGLCK